RFVADAATDLPFPHGGVVGYLAYEFGRFTEPLRHIAARTSALPLAVLRRHDPVLVFERNRGQWALACRTPSSARAPWLERLPGAPPAGPRSLARGPLVPVVERGRVLDAMARVLASLAAGDVSQVNLTQPFSAPLAAPAWALLAALARRHPAPYTAY